MFMLVCIVLGVVFVWELVFSVVLGVFVMVVFVGVIGCVYGNLVMCIGVWVWLCDVLWFL